MVVVVVVIIVVVVAAALTLYRTALLEKLTGSQLARNSPHFMEPEASLPHSQVIVICPYFKPDQSSPCLLPSHSLKIHLNIILPSTPGSPQWSLSLRFPHENPLCTSPLPNTRYMTRPSHSSRLITRITFGRQYQQYHRYRYQYQQQHNQCNLPVLIVRAHHLTPTSTAQRTVHLQIH